MRASRTQRHLPGRTLTDTRLKYIAEEYFLDGRRRKSYLRNGRLMGRQFSRSEVSIDQYIGYGRFCQQIQHHDQMNTIES